MQPRQACGTTPCRSIPRCRRWPANSARQDIPRIFWASGISLAPPTVEAGGGRGYVKPEHRAGFLDMWEGANEFEFTTHPYEGTIYDRDGKEITFKEEFRVAFWTVV